MPPSLTIRGSFKEENEHHYCGPSLARLRVLRIYQHPWSLPKWMATKCVTALGGLRKLAVSTMEPAPSPEQAAAVLDVVMQLASKMTTGGQLRINFSLTEKKQLVLLPMPVELRTRIGRALVGEILPISHHRTGLSPASAACPHCRH
jgi:hypothetical protein